MANFNRRGTEVNASSMADIAFLLLIFFLVTAVIHSEKGITLLLPKKIEIDNPVPRNERNIFNVVVNSQDKILVEGEVLDDVRKLKPMVKEFVLNYGKDEKSSDDPESAVISFKTNRGTSYAAYIAVLDELKGAYYEIYSEKVGLTAEQYRSLDENNFKEKILFDKGKAGIPMNISIAEPSK